MPRGPLLLSIWLATACSHGGAGAVRQPDGGYALSCKGPLSECLRRAEHVCRDAGYTLSEARDVRELLGHESGQSQVLIEKSEATFYCGKRPPRAAITLTRQEAATAPVPAPPVPSAVCVPGATQACVGPAGCSGGQICSADGTRFEACDCGGR